MIAAARWMSLLHSIAMGASLFFYPAIAPLAAEKSKPQKTQTGLASYYARHFHGKETAGGEAFRNDELVAAHRTLPLGTRVRVTNLENGRSVTLRVVDRGATAGNRREGVIIDVSQAAAKQLQMKKDGRVKVRVKVLELGTDDHPPMSDGAKK